MESKADYKDFSDAQLVDQLKVSDAAAFSEIFKRYRGILLLFTFRRLQDVEQAKDLINDAFADIWEKRETINMPGNLRPFLITIIKNKILDLYRHKKVSQKYLDSMRSYLETQVDNTDYLIRQKELSAIIDKEIDALPEKMQRVFILSRKEYMNRKEMSKYLNVPEGYIKINVQRALKILKNRFENFQL